MATKAEKEIRKRIRQMNVDMLREELQKKEVNISRLRNKSELSCKLQEVLFAECAELELSHSAGEEEVGNISINQLNDTVMPQSDTEDEGDAIREADLLRREKAVHQKEMEKMRMELELMRLRNEEISLTRTISPNTSSMRINMGQISDIIQTYNPETDNYEVWEKHVREVREVYGLEELALKTTLITKLKGRAQKFIQSKPSYITLSVEEILNELGGMFQTRQSRLSLKKQFDSRTWHQKELFNEYYQDKIILGNQLEMREKDLIEEVIEGMHDPYLEAQAKIAQYGTISDLLIRFGKLNKIHVTPTTRPTKYEGKSYYPKKTETTQKDAPSRSHPKKEEFTPRKIIRCENCHIRGHTKDNCRRPVIPKGACYVCAKTGHFANECPEAKKNINIVSMGNLPEVYKKVSIKYNCKFGSRKIVLTALLDTGSPISLIREDAIPKDFQKDLHLIKQKNHYKYSGINMSKIKIIQGFSVQIEFENESKYINLQSVPKNTMATLLILGRDFLEKFEFRLVQIREKKSDTEDFEQQILQINVTEKLEEKDKLIFDESIEEKYKSLFRDNFLNNYENRLGKFSSGNDYRMKIRLTKDNTLEQNLAICQNRDQNIILIKKKLEVSESENYELRNGLVYKKDKKGIQFYVPEEMEVELIRSYHEMLGHLGVEKCWAELARAYWFPHMKQKIKTLIENCFKCITYASKSGRVEGKLHPIPKGNEPFQVIHVDHYGPLKTNRNKKRHILVVIDAFTKFTKLYAVRSTSSRETISCLKHYFAYYSQPAKLISDRGTSFTSEEFSEFLEKLQTQHIKVAVGSPQANGQVERVNRNLTAMISKLTKEGKEWDQVLTQVEYALNNAINRSIGKTPAQMLFGTSQRSADIDPLRERLHKNPKVSLEEIRSQAIEKNQKNQELVKKYFDKKRKAARKYKIGDYVVITNYVSTPGINRKFVPKFKGPYMVTKVYPNERYLVKDIEGHQLTQIPYSGVIEAKHMKPWKKFPVKEKL